MHNSQKTVMDYLTSDERQVNHMLGVVDQVMSVMFKRPEDSMPDAMPLHDTESEAHASLQDKALVYLPDEMKSLFADANSIREAIAEMSDEEIKALLSVGSVWRACFRYFQPVAWEAALKRAEGEDK